MAKYAITINELVRHQHQLIIECEDQLKAEMLADDLDDYGMEHPDDITVAAKEIGMEVVRMDRDCTVETDEIEVDDLCEWEE